MGHSNRSRSRERRKSRDKSRSRDRKRSTENNDVLDSKKSRDRSRSRDLKTRDKRSRSRDYRRRERSRSHDRRRERRNRSRSPDRRHKDKKREYSRERRRDRSSSRSKRHIRSLSSEHRDKDKNQPQKVKILSLEEVMMKKKRTEDANHEFDLRKSFQISDEFSQEGFEQFSLDHGIDLAKIETDEERNTVHEKMEDILKAHFAAQGKIYPPPKVEKPAVNVQTGFANDGSFLEQFKKLQEDKKKQEEEDKKRKALEERLKTLPIRRRAGGKILKTGVVAKTKVMKPADSTPGDTFSSYMKEVQKYKRTSCDTDSKTRPLVK